MRTYTNKDITEYAKVYTGFRRRGMRGNIEDPDERWTNNQVDPMNIDSERKDHFPKVRGLRIFSDLISDRGTHN